MTITKYLLVVSLLVASTMHAQKKARTIVSIKGEDFYINNKITYKGIRWKGYRVEGLLHNSRMVQGIFDDLNPDTRGRFVYPDTENWDPDRNTNEFVQAMGEWYQHGLLAVTLNLQGGSPTGYGNKNWINSAFDETGSLRADYMLRLERILNRADELGMVIILGYFYQGQDQHLKDEAAIINGVNKATDWLKEKGYRNVMVEINNECNVPYDHDILRPNRVDELIRLVKDNKKNGYCLLVSTSYGGNFVPLQNVVESADFLLIHGNSVTDPDRITQLVQETKKVSGYKTKPILFNEDDHYNFEKPVNNFVNAVKAHTSWGLFDYRRAHESYNEGFQSVPVDWGIHSSRKKAFFNLLKEIAGGGL